MVRQDEQGEERLLDAMRAIQTDEDSCKWDFGRYASEWTREFSRGRTDAALAAKVGATQQGVTERRSTWKRFGESYSTYSNLSWSHFRVAVGWDDADPTYSKEAADRP